MNRTAINDQLQRLLHIMDRLRDPGGCPWDREQSHETLKPLLLEECYEVLEAMDQGNPQHLREELGDLLFQVIFHARLAKEKGEFDLGDILQGTTDKMIRRHPHVFGQAQAQDAHQALRNWETIKRQEQQNQARHSVLDGVPSRLPALLRAHRLQSKAARVGFDWQAIDPVVAKVQEELAELYQAIQAGERARMEQELGDVLFAMVNLSRFLKIDPEEALRQATQRFIRRFHHVEESLAAMGKQPQEVTLQEMDLLWEEAKAREHSPS